MSEPANTNDTWTHALARVLVRPLVGTGVTPNHITTLRLLTGAMACWLFALGTQRGAIWGGVLWLISAFLDRADGELARLGDMRSRQGHLYDYYSDVLINSGFFLAIGFGLHGSWLGHWSIPLGVVTCVAMLACCVLSEIYETLTGPGVRVWGGAFGFHPDDALYLLAPLAWLGWLAPVLAAASVCTSLIAMVIGVRLLLLRRRVARAPAA
ncbi:MAG: CDP-alcohol phosphatidyltransferase family protein [Caulobacterales bacterium]|jgi:phosphatidylglycerophosphate synthase